MFLPQWQCRPEWAGGPARVPAPVGGLWTGSHTGTSRREPWEEWEPSPPPHLLPLEASTTTALFTGVHGPSGRLCYRQAGAAGRQSFTASKDPVVSLCG